MISSALENLKRFERRFILLKTSEIDKLMSESFGHNFSKTIGKRACGSMLRNNETKLDVW